MCQWRERQTLPAFRPTASSHRSCAGAQRHAEPRPRTPVKPAELERLRIVHVELVSSRQLSGDVAADCTREMRPGTNARRQPERGVLHPLRRDKKAIGIEGVGTVEQLAAAVTLLYTDADVPSRGNPESVPLNWPLDSAQQKLALVESESLPDNSIGEPSWRQCLTAIDDSFVRQTRQ